MTVARISILKCIGTDVSAIAAQSFNGKVISLISRSILIYFPNSHGLNSTTKVIKRWGRSAERI